MMNSIREGRRDVIFILDAHCSGLSSFDIRLTELIKLPFSMASSLEPEGEQLDHLFNEYTPKSPDSM